MLKISDSSWHYRFYVKLWELPPKSLCGYFWGLVFGIIFLPFWLLLAATQKFRWVRRLLFAVFIAWAIFVLIAAVIDSWWNLLIIPVGLAVLAAIVIGVLVSIVVIQERRGSKPATDPGLSGVTWEYVKAKKRRVCPLIEVTTGEEVHARD